MATDPPSDAIKPGYPPTQLRQFAALSGPFQEPLARQHASLLPQKEDVVEQTMTFDRQQLQRTGERDPWATAQPPTTPRNAYTHPRTPLTIAHSRSSISPPGLTNSDRTTVAFGAFPSQQAARWSRGPYSTRQPGESFETPTSSPWPASPSIGSYSTDPMTSGEYGSRSGYAAWQGSSWPGPPLRRTSSDEYRLRRLAGGHYGGDAASNASSQSRPATYPQRRPSNRDEFDGPSQLLDKPGSEAGYEPKEEELPQLPVNLYAQEQDEILSKVNDRVSQCAFDFVVKYQFPIPIEPDKRPVRVPGDREWSDWVYLLKRLATKRRIPARVLYNGQIKQLVTILENSLEMRHAAKHQSRPLKDDRNILQLISSGLQVAKILKDAPAMQYLDSLYMQTERLIQSRRAPRPPASYPTSVA